MLKLLLTVRACVTIAYDRVIADLVYTGDDENKLKKIIDNIKSEGVGKRYDCIIGLSGE